MDIDVDFEPHTPVVCVYHKMGSKDVMESVMTVDHVIGLMSEQFDDNGYMDMEQEIEHNSDESYDESGIYQAIGFNRAEMASNLRQLHTAEVMTRKLFPAVRDMAENLKTRMDRYNNWDTETDIDDVIRDIRGLSDSLENVAEEIHEVQLMTRCCNKRA